MTNRMRRAARVSNAGAVLHGSACAAENTALRGQFERARASLDGLLATPRLPADTRAWLLTTAAELEQRAGQADAADAAYRAALQAAPDDYTRLAYADFLIEQQRAAQALAVLQDRPRSDAVLAAPGDCGRAGEGAGRAGRHHRDARTHRHGR